MSKFRKILKFLDDHLEEIILTLLLGTMSVVIGIQVFMRYVMQASLSWSEEMARYLFIWLAYIGISYGVKRNKHIKVEAFHLLLPKPARKYATLLSDIIFLIFSIIIIFKGFEMSSRILKLGQFSPALGIPMGFIYLAAPIGFFLTAVRITQKIVYDVSNMKKGVV